MKKLKTIKNYHLGMGLLILAIQIIFQISNSVYFFGLTLILFSFYESIITKKLILQKGDARKVRKILKQLEWFNLFSIIPILLIIAKIITDTTGSEEITALLLNHPIGWINILIVGGIVMHLSLKSNTKKIEKEIIDS